jgi:gluconolactonase
MAPPAWHTPEMHELVEVASGLQFPEGPIAMADGSVIVVEMFAGRLTRLGPGGRKETIAEIPGGPNGAAIGPDGAVYVCNNGGSFTPVESRGLAFPGRFDATRYIGGRIQRVDLDTGKVEDLYTECDGFGLRGPNDIVFDDQGGFYFTDLGKSRARDVDKGGIYYAKADGSSIVNVVYGTDHANGIGLSPDGRTIYAAETLTGRLWAWDIEEPGKVKPSTTPYAPGRLHFDFPGWQLLDSLAVDSEGNVCVATLVVGAISVISPKGEMIDQIKVPKYDVFVTNICFGGPDLKTAYITASGYGDLYAMEWHCPGLKLNYNA